MDKDSFNRLHPLVKFIYNSEIILEFIEEEILKEIFRESDIYSIQSKTVFILRGKKYVTKEIKIEYSEHMHGQYGMPTNYQGDFDSFNTVINIILED